MEILKEIGLVLFAVPFVLSGISHLLNRNAMAVYAQFKRVPLPLTSTVVSGIILIVAPILIVFGVIPEIALGVLAAFLIVTSFFMHNFWSVSDESRVSEQINFNKNIGLAGAALALLALLS